MSKGSRVEEMTLPVDAWVELRIGGDRVTRVEAEVDEVVEVVLEEKDGDGGDDD